MNIMIELLQLSDGGGSVQEVVSVDSARRRRRSALVKQHVFKRHVQSAPAEALEPNIVKLQSTNKEEPSSLKSEKLPLLGIFPGILVLGVVAMMVAIGVIVVVSRKN